MKKLISLFAIALVVILASTFVKRFALISVLLAALNLTAKANDVYIAQAATGSANGSSCANAYAYGYFNASGNWTSSTPSGNQIGPGTNVHLCGTFTGTGGSEELIAQGSGTSGNPISILFESGATLKAPYWGPNDGTNPSGGAINTGSYSYITINGQGTGVIENTLNGDPGATCAGGSCSVQQATNMIYINGGSYITVENLSLLDTYVKTPCGANPSPNGGNLDAIYIVGNASHITVDHVTADEGPSLFTDNGNNTSYITFSNNTLSRAATEIVFAATGSSQNFTHVNVFGNEMFDNYVWWDSADENHLQAVHMWSLNGATSSDVNVYNNNVHGDFGGQTCGGGGSHTTAYLYFEGMNGINIFNNLLLGNPNDVPANGMISFQNGTSNGFVVNNTLYGPSTPSNIGFLTYSPSTTFENNIDLNVDQFICTDSTSEFTLSNRNVFFNGQSQPFTTNSCATTYSFSGWQGLGLDANSVTSNPNLNGSYIPNSGSPAIGLGANLYSTCNGQSNPGLGALCFDKAGSARPSSGNWDAGALQSGSSSANRPASPTNLSGVVK